MNRARATAANRCGHRGTGRCDPLRAGGGAVDRVSLSVGRGEVFELLGPNGSGKTTLIRGLCGLVQLAGGGDPGAGPRSRTGRAHPDAIGYMSQRRWLYRRPDAEQKISFYSGIYGLSGTDTVARKRELVEQVGLGPTSNGGRAGSRAAGSSGWRLACALLHRPKLIFLDEPTDRHRPGRAPRSLGPALSPVGRGDHAVRDHPLHGRGGACARVGYIYLGRLLAAQVRRKH